MKLAILGGGGFRVPLVYRALLHDTHAQRISAVALYDTDAERLRVVTALLAQLGAGHADAPRVESTTSLDEALQGADFVFSAIRVGGLAGRTQDERVALKLGVLGQETTGPGGLAYALRTIPVAVRIAERIRAVAPTAYVMNFTNPAGMITEAMQGVLDTRVVGICDTPGELGRRIAGQLGVPASRVRLDYVGLNHLGWLRRIVHDGVDLLPSVLDSPGALEEADVFGADWLRSLGSIPNEYLYYYYFHRDAVRKILAGSQTRGEYLLAQQSTFYAEAGKDLSRASTLWRRTLDEREATYLAEARESEREVPDRSGSGEPGGYEGVALAVMAAIARGEQSTMILNVRNGSTLPAFDPAAVIEVPSVVSANGASPIATAPPDLHQLGLMQQVKAVERLVIEAASTGSRSLAVKAFALHPLVDSVSLARDLVDGYIRAIPEVAAVLEVR
ncbi:6-phospho-beta-glucosidase [Tenggerimyces flavus]|uniref:6-phospho-beta-glucosidase n=1 Tax=Tenggerimyces flavus TaxID=1708749 RepID=A0ABV7Y8I7_9ACTN|nr:6-phospho-beta-glucosidase [Tenggerimyces flavus]MBM7788463.1 6-phospho-beta-glucosidase [Tenggerimyces flavus]